MKSLIIRILFILSGIIVASVLWLEKSDQPEPIPRAIPVIEETINATPEPVSKLVLPCPTIRLEREAWLETKEMIKFYEGFYAETYTCPAGHLTIGYGFTEPDLVKMGTISEAEAEEILDNKMRATERSVETIVSVPLSPAQKCALVSFAYNCGVPNLKTLVSGPGRLNDGNYDSIEAIMPMYRKGGGKVLAGLVKRRASELEMWQNG